MIYLRKRTSLNGAVLFFCAHMEKKTAGSRGSGGAGRKDIYEGYEQVPDWDMEYLHMAGFIQGKGRVLWTTFY